MQRVEAIIRPDKLQGVKAALEELDHAGMTLSEVRGHGVQRGVTEQWRGRTFAVEYLTKIKIELVVKDEDVDAVVNRIVEAARTGEVGDGKIFVSPVSRAVRIRTGEENEQALYPRAHPTPGPWCSPSRAPGAGVPRPNTGVLLGIRRGAAGE